VDVIGCVSARIKYVAPERRPPILVDGFEPDSALLITLVCFWQLIVLAIVIADPDRERIAEDPLHLTAMHSHCDARPSGSACKLRAGLLQ
jgi:hypothetical protein